MFKKKKIDENTYHLTDEEGDLVYIVKRQQQPLKWWQALDAEMNCVMKPTQYRNDIFETLEHEQPTKEDYIEGRMENHE